jgi:ribosomal-protein-serine acetyltransferase
MHPELTAGPYLLRGFRLEDVELVYQAVVDSFSELTRWFWWAHENYSRHDTQTFLEGRFDAWERDKECGFAILDAGGKFVGSVGLNLMDHTNRHCNLGYWVRTSETGRGIATLAAKRAAEFALTELGLIRVEIVCAVGNDASRRVAEKISAVREGISRKHILLKGKPLDAYVYSLVSEDLGLPPKHLPV